MTIKKAKTVLKSIYLTFLKGTATNYTIVI